jgi:cell division protein FtsQ
MAEPLNAPHRAGAHAATKASKATSPSRRKQAKQSTAQPKAEKPKTSKKRVSKARSHTKPPAASRTRKRAATKAPSSRKAKAASTPATHRKIAARRSDVAQQRRRKRLFIAGGLAGVVLVGITVWGVLHLSVFRLHHLTISGNHHESAAAIVNTAGLSSSPALIDVSAGSIEHQLAQLPWVKSASVTVQWPSSIKLTITERTAAASVDTASGWLIVDGTGRVLARSRTQPSGLVVIQAPLTGSPAVSQWFGGSIRHGFLVAGTLPRAFKSQVALIVVHPSGAVTLHLVRPVIIEMGQATELPQKYEDIAAVIAGATLHAGDVLDVSVPQSSTISGP